MESVYIIYFLVGVSFFVTIFYGYRNNIDHPAVFLTGLFGLLLLVFGGILYPTSERFSYKNTKVEFFEYHKFSTCVSILVDNKIWTYQDVDLFNTINKDSSVELKIGYNFFNSEVNRSLVINNKEY